MSETKNTEIAQNSPTASATSVAPIIEKEFELAIFENVINDMNGKEEWQRVSYQEPMIVKVKTPAELKEKMRAFEDCGQRVQIVRQLSERVISQGTPSSQPQIRQQTIAQPSIPEVPTSTHVPQSASLPTKIEICQPPQKECIVHKPRYFKVGDIEVKDDNGKIYQKQWMRLSEAEAANIRVVNDKNNATVNLTGKHLEMKKWVLVEDNNTSDDVIESMEGNL